MAFRTVAPYGSWKSPLTAKMVAAGEIGLEQVRLDGKDIYWIERRPQENGRKVIVRRSSDGRIADVTPPGFNARTRVHEYGGGDYAVRSGTIVFSNFADQRLYLQIENAAPRPVTPTGSLRFADGIIDARRTALFCVREDHGSGGEPSNSIVKMALDSENIGTVLASGNDFYSSPRLSPDGSRMAWLTWNHPNMPWDGTELWQANVDSDGSLIGAIRVTGGAGESICQPQWSPSGVLHFISDRTGWWNLYRFSGSQIDPIYSMTAEFGEPHWVFGGSLYAFANETEMLCTYTKDGRACLAILDGVAKTLEPIEFPYSAISSVHANGTHGVFIAASEKEPASVVALDLKTRTSQVLRRSRADNVDSGYLSQPRAVEFSTANSATAHAFFYPPANRDFEAPSTDKPPLVVISHGGPTSASSASLRYGIQYWTSRGIAVLDVNYRGSSGYGRAYREALKGQWGIADVDDCVNGARFLVDGGHVDPKRLAIRGGSAGGYTTLCALTFRETFKAGASHYGISDLEALATDTHKFESRYLDSLIGPYPQRRDLYVARSPIHFTDRLDCPMILFQGLEDKVVPPNQAEKMFEAVRQKKLPVAYVTFPGEQHGFRKAENIQRALEAELYFYSKIFRFELLDPIAPVPIENL